MSRAGLLILDRDGTVIVEKNYLSTPEGVELLPGVAQGLRRFQAKGYAIAIVTNQSGIGRGYYGEEDLQAVNAKLVDLLAAADVHIDGIWYCPHSPSEECGCRKPETGMFEAAARELGYAPSECLVVGDKDCDIDLGGNAGARTALVRTGYGLETEAGGNCAPDLIVDNLLELAQVAG